MTNRTKIINANSLHCRLAAKMSFLMFFPFSSPEPIVSWSRGRETRVGYKLSRVALGTRMLFFPARFAHARYSSRVIDRFLNWGDHGKPKSGKIKGRCQHPLDVIIPSFSMFTGHCFCTHCVVTAFLSLWKTLLNVGFLECTILLKWTSSVRQLSETLDISVIFSRIFTFE